MQLPTEDKHSLRQSAVEMQIAILMGGRVAEELTQEDITTGAGNDIERATEMAHRMVCEWGMSQLGPLSFGGKNEPVFLGRDFAQRSEYSENTAMQIDLEVQRIVGVGLEKARSILKERRDVLDRLAHDLLELESLEGQHVYDLIHEMTGLDFAPEKAEAGSGSREPVEETTAEPRVADEASSEGLGIGGVHPGASDPIPSTE